MDNLPPEQQRVSCEPDIKVHKRSNDKDDILLLACDGLWDVFQNLEAITEVRRLYALGEDDMVLIADEMIDTSLSKGKSFIYNFIFYSFFLNLLLLLFFF